MQPALPHDLQARPFSAEKLTWYVLQKSGSAASMGFTLLLQALPALLLSLWGGALADRLPARPLLIVTQLTHGALAAALAAIAWTDIGGLPLVYAISLLGGAVSAIEGPVMAASAPAWSTGRRWATRRRSVR